MIPHVWQNTIAVRGSLIALRTVNRYMYNCDVKVYVLYVYVIYARGN